MKAITDEESDAMQMSFPVYVHGMLKTDSYSGALRPDDERGEFTIRVPGERGSAAHLEHRVADGAANLYTAGATVLQAARLGVANKYKLPPAETADGLESASTDVVVPENLGEAMRALQADQAITEALGPDMVAHFCGVKETEWQRYLGYTTDWEINEYQHFL